VTTDEELNLLDQQLRRLKIEYEVFFNNPSKRPPTDVEWKVLSLIRKFSDSARLTFSQRFKYNEMAQRYAIQSDLWRKKTRIREEGYRRPQDALLSVSGVRAGDEHEAKHHHAYGLSHQGKAEGTEAQAEGDPGIEQPVRERPVHNRLVHDRPSKDQPFSVQCSGAAAEREQVETLYKALSEAKRKSGEKVSGSFDSFAAFVQKKTSELRKQHHCDTVVYSVETQNGQVKLTAKAKS
jgi:hypothetical protein